MGQNLVITARWQTAATYMQVVLATNGRSTYVLKIYNSITWTTGDASGGRNGFGGTIARAGINSGTGRSMLHSPWKPRYVQLPQRYNYAVFFVQLRKIFLTKTLH